LLFARHRLVKREGALRPVGTAEARHAGSTVLLLTAISALLVLGIVGLQWRRGGDIGLLSVAMPLVGLVWLGSLGVLSRRHRVDATADLLGRSSSLRAPNKPDALSTPSQRPSRPPTDRRISA
jgi:hypothetical protein